MALSRIKTDMIVDDAISSAKIDDDTIVAADIIPGQITNVKISSGAGDKIAHTKTTVGTASTLDYGTSASNVVRLDGTPKLPVLSGTNGYFLYSNAGVPAWTNVIDGGTF